MRLRAAGLAMLSAMPGSMKPKRTISRARSFSVVS
jgi:hypothetical protein